MLCGLCGQIETETRVCISCVSLYCPDGVANLLVAARDMGKLVRSGKPFNEVRDLYQQKLGSLERSAVKFYEIYENWLKQQVSSDC